jgi:tetratricopeptide (TPR) repeat protein
MTLVPKGKIKKIAALSLAALLLSAFFFGCARKARRPVEGEKVLSHVVAAGESLEEIADDYYGDPERAGEIREFNLLESDGVSEGDVLRVYMKPDDMETLRRREQARVPYNSGLELVARGSYLDATKEFREAALLDPGFAEAQYNLGVTYQKLDAHEKAIGAFERAIRLRPRKPDYHYAIGGSFFHQGRYADAIKAFERTLDIDPAHLKAQYSVAAAYEKNGDTGRAIAEWEKYLELDPESDWAQRARARLAALRQ